MSEGCLTFVPQINSEFILSCCGDLVQVGQTCGDKADFTGGTMTILTSQRIDAIFPSKQSTRTFQEQTAETFEITQPEFIVHVSKASCVILPVTEKVHFPTLTSQENLRERDNNRPALTFMKKTCP